ncbi:MAG: bifunctional folylpolyglutamate synthase/dihydrofolate synthase [Lachnospiraceae bacterium]
MKRPGDYQEAVEYIEELPRFTKKHSLDHTREFLRLLGDPGLDRKIIHVAGTNGKGSVCACLQAILQAEEKRCGFFTSPHLVTINERIQIGRKPVDDPVFYQVFCQAWEAAQTMEEAGMGHPSYFEFLFGMGMAAFARTDVEYVILETGLGGRLDATNAPEHPALAIITSISLDHTDILGETMEEIAAEKAGIIKPGVPVLFDGSSPGAAAVIRTTAARVGAPCREIRKMLRNLKFTETILHFPDGMRMIEMLSGTFLWGLPGDEHRDRPGRAEELLKDEKIHRSGGRAPLAAVKGRP